MCALTLEPGVNCKDNYPRLKWLKYMDGKEMNKNKS